MKVRSKEVLNALKITADMFPKPDYERFGDNEEKDGKICGLQSYRAQMLGNKLSIFITYHCEKEKQKDYIMIREYNLGKINLGNYIVYNDNNDIISIYSNKEMFEFSYEEVINHEY